MSHAQWSELAEVYAIDALDGEELEAFRSHLETGCVECRRRVREAQETLLAFHDESSRVAPPAAVKTALFQRIGAEGFPPRAHGPRVTPALLAAGATGIVLIATFIVMARMPAGVPSAARVAVHDTGMTEILSAPSVVRVELAGQPEDPSAGAVMVWNPETKRGCFTTRGLKALGPDRVFQLWAIAEGEAPVSVGVFAVDAEGCVHADFPALANRNNKTYGTFAVTAEPAGGVPRPTGPMHLSGRIPL